MFARVSRYSGDTAGMRQGFESVAPELERMDGFVEARFLIDDEHGRAISMTFWETRGALEASAEAAHAMRTRATTPADATIEGVEVYEVGLTVKPGSGVG